MGQSQTRPVAPSGGRRRVLCLCGNGSNKMLGEIQANNLQFNESHRLHPSFLEGPFQVDNAYDPAVQQAFRGQAFYSWTPEVFAGRCDSAALQPAIEHVLEYIKKEGPFDGIFGFSMGGLVATLVAEALRAEHAKADSGAQRWQQCAPATPAGIAQLPPLFVITACPSYFAADIGAAEAAFQEVPQDAARTFETPTLVLIGGKDKVAFKARKLAAACVWGHTFEMKYAAHELPMACTKDPQLRTAVRQLLSKTLNA